MLLLGLYLTQDAWLTIWDTAVYYQHALYVLLIPFIVFWLCWVRRQRLLFCAPVFTWIGPLMVGLGWGTYALGMSVGKATIIQFGALLIVIGCVLSVLGTDVFYRFMPAFFVLIFVIPVPSPIESRVVEPIQAATTDITQVVYELFGQEIMREGNLMITAQNDVLLLSQTGRVMSLIMTFVLISYAFAFGMPLRASARMVIILISPIIALLTNVGRSLATTWMYNVYDLVEVNHILSYVSWITIAVALAALYGIIRLLLWTAMPIRRYSFTKDA
ncbi:exosortase/archaeosortase family protein [Poriferisphaera sp. WC338]|uniref:exosortase/archaeosortase family protein n=1 Tax=Poriferisphaera sp. WC338 TaxID=3425129 RepID=UPI003D8174E0